MKIVRVFSNSDAMAEEIARQWQEQAHQAKKDGRTFSVVFSGAGAAEQAYRKLAAKKFFDKIPWHCVHIFWADERCVLPQNKESNYGNCRRFLLDHIPIPDENIHRIRGEEDPSIESARYAKEIQDHILIRKGQTTLFDWTFLGVGSDGHTASLFSGQDSLISKKLCEKVRHPQSDQIRITLTPLALKNSNRITYHVFGREKAQIVSDLISEYAGKDSYPAAQISGEWYLDSEAATNINLDSTGF